MNNNWVQRLNEQYPQFEIYGDPETHYRKIKDGIGSYFYVSKNSFDNGNMNLYASIDESTKNDHWKILILGNIPPSGTKIAVSLFKPVNYPNIDQTVELLGLAFASKTSAYEKLCEEFGQCLTPNNDWLEFSPNRKLIKSKILRNFVNVYSNRSSLFIFIGEFTIVYEQSPNEKFLPPTFEEVTGGLRTSASYTHTLQEILSIVTISGDTMPVGSFKYNVHKYPGDVDIFEKYDACCSIEEAQTAAANAFKQIIIKTKATPNTYLGDFKAGEDDRYSIDIGKWENDVLVGYNKSKIERSIKNLRKQRLISQSDLDLLLSLVKTNLDVSEWDKLSSNLRQNQVLRWNAQEIMQGFKLLPGAERIELEDAIAQRTLVKVDLWSRINGRYMEVTNFFMINAIDKSGKRIATLTQEMPDYKESIAKDVRFYSSPEHRKTLKALKRLWSLALFEDNYELAGRISPLFGTNASALNQINGEAEVLAFMLVRLPDPPLAQIMEQIDGFKPRIDQLNDNLDENEELYQIINNIIDPFYDQVITNYHNFEEAADLLDEFQTKINLIVEAIVYDKAKEIGMENPADFI